jgi:threonine dehydrogenase-like Zn-dependent dehydrogenase
VVRRIVQCGLGAQESGMQGGQFTRGIVMSDVIVVIGPGSIGQAIARWVSAGKQVLLADLRHAWHQRGVQTGAAPPAAPHEEPYRKTTRQRVPVASRCFG